MALWKARGGSLNKEFEGQGGKSLNKEFDFRSWHCGRHLNKNLELDHGIVEGKGGKFKQKFRI